MDQVLIERERAIHLAESLLGRPVRECVPFGAGKFSQTFALAGAGGGEYVLRVAPPDELLQLFYEYRMMRREPEIHRRLLEETEVPAPPILASDFSRGLIDRDFLIMPRLAGEPLNQAGLGPRERARALREWGRLVAEIHKITERHNQFGYLGGDSCMPPQATWRDAFAIMYLKELEDIVRTGIYDEATRHFAMRLLEQHLENFEHCLRSRLCHGDLWITNLLVEGTGRVTALLDFDRACWGDPEWDLAIAEYCGITEPAFWEGYGANIDSGHAGAVRRFFYLLYEHQKYIVISMSSRRNDPARARNYARDCLAAMEHLRKTGRPVF